MNKVHVYRGFICALLWNWYQNSIVRIRYLEQYWNMSKTIVLGKLLPPWLYMED